MVGYLEVSNMWPEVLGDYAVIDNAACVSYFVCVLALGVTSSAPI